MFTISKLNLFFLSLGFIAFACLGTAFFKSPTIMDASEMEKVSVKKIWNAKPTVDQTIPYFQEILAKAKQEKIPVSIAAIRHSMGGHIYTPKGYVINILPLKDMNYDTENQTLRVGAGATWAEVIKYLDSFDRSVAVMQASNSFSVGGSLSVNCHGWPVNYAPIASTVQSFRMMLESGEVVTCSREENAELFSLALGGYGLFGIILDADLTTAPNERYLLKRSHQPSRDYQAAMDEALIGRDNVRMVYGRLKPTKKGFLEDSILNVYSIDPESGNLPKLSKTKYGRLMGLIYRWSGLGDVNKKMRWKTEVDVAKSMESRPYSRNQLLNEPVDEYLNRSHGSTDILHEYFIPRDQLLPFLDDLKTIIPKYRANLLNVTVRNVEKDNDAYLKYANEPMYALVLAFRQAKNKIGERRMKDMTRELIDRAIGRNGTYYLCYRLHATPEQLEKGYPNIQEFFALKEKYDPDCLFQNQFWRQYSNPYK